MKLLSNRARKILNRFFWLGLLSGLCLFEIVVLGFIPRGVQGSIDLLSFSATPGDQIIVLEWSTATEINTAGFYVLRSSSQTTGYARISPFIFSKGDTLTGSEYEFLDEEVENGTRYWYKLEEIDTNQKSSFHGPVSSIAGNSSQTATVTITPTQTKTQTPTTTPTIVVSGNNQTPNNPTNTPIPRQSIQPTNPLQIIPSSTNESTAEVTQAGAEYPYPGAEDVLEIYVSSTATIPALVEAFAPFPSVEIKFPTRASLETNSSNTDQANFNEGWSDGSKDSDSRLLWVIIVSLVWLVILFRFIRVVRSLSS